MIISKSCVAVKIYLVFEVHLWAVTLPNISPVTSWLNQNQLSSYSFSSSMKTQKEKQTALAEQTRHLKDVKVARDHYRSCISHARDSNQAIAHISFDMAQQVST